MMHRDDDFIRVIFPFHVCTMCSPVQQGTQGKKNIDYNADEYDYDD